MPLQEPGTVCRAIPLFRQRIDRGVRHLGAIVMPIAVGFVVLFNLLLMDRVMNVIWPEPIIGFFG